MTGLTFLSFITLSFLAEELSRPYSANTTEIVNIMAYSLSDRWLDLRVLLEVIDKLAASVTSHQMTTTHGWIEQKRKEMLSSRAPRNLRKVVLEAEVDEYDGGGGRVC